MAYTGTFDPEKILTTLCNLWCEQEGVELEYLHFKRKEEIRNEQVANENQKTT